MSRRAIALTPLAPFCLIAVVAFLPRQRQLQFPPHPIRALLSPTHPSIPKTATLSRRCSIGNGSTSQAVST